MRFVHLEDNSQDAELIHEMLDEAWPGCEVTVVDNRDGFTSALKTACNVILSDFTMPAFDGLSALKIAREQAPETPFIFVSGSIGEERAIEAVQNGASDYVIKDRMMRLIVSIRRALQDAQDRAERRSLEEQFLRVQRLETIGMLAAGIVHDLNNVLAPVVMGVPIVKQRTEDPTVLKLLSSFEQSAARGTALLRQILSFARGVGGEQRLLDFGEVAQELSAVVEPTLGRTIEFELSLPDNLWLIVANPTQLHQVLLNLCVNARDAMPDGGRLRVAASNCHVDETVAGSQDRAAGRYLRIKVSDTGPGIPPDVVPRLWEPFFTTKAPGKGSGLGLATVRGIVENHRGFIVVKSRVGSGTTFEVYFPAPVG